MQAGTPRFCSVISDSAQSIVREKKTKQAVYSSSSASTPLVTSKEQAKNLVGKNILEYTFSPRRFVSFQGRECQLAKSNFLVLLTYRKIPPRKHVYDGSKFAQCFLAG